MPYNEVGGVFGDNEPEKVEITFAKVDDTFLDKFNKFLERAESHRERYDLTWNGKAAAFAEAGKPLEPAKTLRPDLDESVDFDKTQNLFITGDNLEALKLLQESYLNKVDMIYIDPPYNTGHDFIYHDNFHKTLSDEIDDSRDDDGNRRYAVNSKENGRYHSDWLSMMYPRLMIARNLLSDRGLIFISIDDTERNNLEIMCDEVFGQDNKIATFVISSNSTKNNAKYVSITNEYVVCYCRQTEHLPGPWRVVKNNADEFLKRARNIYNMDISEEEKHNELLTLVKYPRFYDFDHYTYVDSKGVYQTSDPGGVQNGNKTTVILHPVTKKPCSIPRDGWRYSDDEIKRKLANDEFAFGADETIVPRPKRYIDEYLLQVPRSTVFFDSQSTTHWLKDNCIPFEFPKPIEMVSYLLGITGCSVYMNSTILDFFAGSGTTAHAVMQLNAEDGGHRKFIMVQLPEECSEKSEAYKAGYKTIDQLSRERIRRAAKKIKESDKNADDHDYGFRALYIDKANAKDDISVPADSLQQSQLSFQVDDIYADRSPLDLLFGVLVAKGWQLDGEIEQCSVNDNNVYLYDYVPGAGMVACFDNELADEAINQIIDMHPQVAVFRETAFKRSDEKINLMERFKNDSSETRVWVI